MKKFVCFQTSDIGLSYRDNTFVLSYTLNTIKNDKNED